MLGRELPGNTDSGLQCLIIIAQYYHLCADYQQIKHQFGQNEQPFSEGEILRAAKAIDFKAKKIKTHFDKLNNSSLPAIAKSRSGEYFIIARIQSEDQNAHSEETSDDRPENQNQSRILIQQIKTENNGLPDIISTEELEALWTGEIILFKRKGNVFSNKKFDISWFIPSLVKYRKYFKEVLIISFFLQIFALITPLFFQVVMDKVLVHKGLTTLDVLAIGFFIIAAFDMILGGLRNYIFSHTANRVDVELGARLFHHLLALPLAWFESRQVGQSVARVHELDSIRNFITGTALTLLIDLSFTLIFFIVMWLYSPTLTWVVLGTIPFYIILSVFITPVLRHRLDQKFKYGAENQAFLVESVTGIETLKTMAVEPQMQRKWEEQLAKYINASFSSQNLNNIANQIAGFISKMATLLIIWFGAHLVINGELSVGQLIAFNMFAGRVSGPILKLVQLWQDFQQAGISVQRLGDILNTPKEPGFDPSRSTLPELKGQVNFRNVRFRYRPDGPLILDNISLTVTPGEVIGIVGKSGSGKSTLTKLIQRLYVPESGQVKIDGVDLNIIDTAWLRKHVGVVLQENFLFNRTVRENIALSNPGLSMKQVVRAAQLSGAHDFILELPKGYDTLVGEQGSNLSGGQRQRIAIARALISNPELLIFDEATSALDYESERIIQNNMSSICQGRTVFIIAHRLSTVRRCDRIIVMDKGRIVETGSHEQLIKHNGYYAELYSYQNHVPPIKRNNTRQLYPGMEEAEKNRQER